MKGSPQWKELAESSVKRLPDIDLSLKDWQSSEFTAIVDSATKNKDPNLQRDQMKRLADVLDKHWDSVYAHRLETHVYNAKSNEFLEITVPSSFSKSLVQRAWLPSTLPVHGTNSKVLFRGSELFNRASNRIESLLHTHAPYLDVNLQSEKFLAHLKVRSKISRDDLLKWLVSWSDAVAHDDSETFCTSIDHMCSVYCYLLEEGSQDIIDKLADDSPPLIFVPSRYEEGTNSCDDVRGRFLSIHDVCWMDPTTVLNAKQTHNRSLPDVLPRVLSLHYHYKHQMQEVFKKLQIRETPLIRMYIVLLKYISSLNVEPDLENVRDFTSIVTHLGKYCLEHREHKSFLSGNLKGQGLLKIFPSHRHVWVSLSDCLLENDDPKLAKTFSKVEGVHFIQWPTKFKGSKHWNQAQIVEEKEEFLRICNIPKLSDRVRTRIYHGGMTMPMDELKARISLWVPLVQKFLFHYCKDQYNLLLKDGIAERLSRLQVFSAGEVKCLYYIEHEGCDLESPDPAARVCVLEIDASEIPTIYVAEKKKDKTPSFLLEPFTQLFAHRVGEDEESRFLDFLGRIFYDLPEDAEDVEALAKEYELSDLGETEVVWEVPLPKVVPVEESSSEEEEEEEGGEHEGGVAREAADAHDEGVDRPMTSWPPKAAIDPVQSSSKKRRDPTVAVSTAVPGTSPGAGVIGEDELQEVRKKHALESEQAPPSLVCTPMHDPARQGGPRDPVRQEGPQSTPREGPWNAPREGPRNIPKEVDGSERGGGAGDDGEGIQQGGRGERGPCLLLFSHSTSSMSILFLLTERWGNLRTNLPCSHSIDSYYCSNFGGRREEWGTSS